MTTKMPKTYNETLHKLLETLIKEIQEKEREEWMDTNGQDWKGLHLGNLEKNSARRFSSLWQIASIKAVLDQSLFVM